MHLLNDEEYDLSALPEDAWSAAYAAACAKLREQDRHIQALRKAADSDGATVTKRVAEAEKDYWRLADEAYTRGMADLAAMRGQAVAARTEEALAAPTKAAIALAVSTLIKSGPMTAAEITARRLPGLSHNVVRPILKLAQDQGLVERRQSGRRVLWIATDIDSPE